jgi:hypothetical protein
MLNIRQTEKGGHTDEQKQEEEVLSGIQGEGST